MIGEVLEITIVVSMLVLVGYPSALMVLDSLRGLQKRMIKVVENRRDRAER